MNRPPLRKIVSILLLTSSPGLLAEDPISSLTASDLQSMVDESSGSLILEAGIYHLDETVTLDLARHHASGIRTEGPVRVIMNAAGPAFHLIGSHEGTASPTSFKPETWHEASPLVDGLEILGNHPEATGIQLDGTMQAIISRVTVRNALHGIHLTNRNRNVIISDCQLYENQGIGLYLDDVNLHQINVANSHISYNRQGGIVVRNGNVRNLHVGNCDIEANMPGDATPTFTANILIDQQNILEPRRSIAEVAITGCTIQHSARYGKEKKADGGANIRILGNSDHLVNMVTITGNVLSDTTTHVDLNHVSDVTLTGNTFFTTEPNDLIIRNSQRIIVQANAFNPREPGATGGIQVHNSSHCVLSGLTIHAFANPEAALLLKECQFMRISDSIFSDCKSGIVLEDCEFTTVHDCTLTGMSPEVEAISIRGGDKNESRNNIVTFRSAGN